MSENEKQDVTLEVSTKKAKKTPKAKKKEQTFSVVTWFKEVRAEAFKVVWPSRQELAKMTFTVIVTSLLFGVLIAGMDTVFMYGVDFLIRVLRG